MPLPLETNRLFIREFTENDAEAFHATLGDPKVMGRIPGGPSSSVEETRKKIQKIIKYYQKWGCCMWALILKESGEMIGDCGLMPVEGKGPEIELTYDIALVHWGKGYATESSIECLRYGLEEMNLKRIIAITFPDHIASMRVMEKAGMSRIQNKCYYNQEMAVYEKKNGKGKLIM